MPKNHFFQCGKKDPRPFDARSWLVEQSVILNYSLGYEIWLYNKIDYTINVEKKTIFELTSNILQCLKKQHKKYEI